MARIDKKTVKDVDIAAKTVLLRVDYNVPFKPGTTEISDDSRITASIRTVRYLADRGCRIVLCSHLGRPNGRVVEELRMAPVAERLSGILQAQVGYVADSATPAVRRSVDALARGELLLLENLRFRPEEEENAPAFAAELASLADIFVNDAFGAAHRAHASTEGVAHFLPAVAGLLMARELEALGAALESPRRPFVGILGGAKVSDKLAALERLATRVDTLILGGGMAATFLKAQGMEVGQSLVEEGRVSDARSFLSTASDRDLAVLLPADVVVADSFSAHAKSQIVPVGDIPQGWRVMDIGPRTIENFEEALARAKTVIWNGPMGVNEWEAFARGTERVARMLAGLEDATTVIGGGRRLRRSRPWTSTRR